MAYSFEEIMKYHPDNEDVYGEIKDLLSGNSLVPFVGAGLTNFAYGTWSGALEKLAENITDTKTKQKIQQLINDKKLLKAADELEKAVSPHNFSLDLVGFFSAEKLEAKRDQLPREAISLLPYLFPNLVLTTNFDQTLETVYQKCGHPFATVLHPGEKVLLRQFLRDNRDRGLLKLHGTIIGSKIDYDKIVFTLRQYDRHYRPCSRLGAALTACYRQKMMLFLGCNLEKDRTMEVLRQVWKKGQTHYAILCCPESERDARIRELGQMGIRTIVYPEGRHEAVRVILEKLLEDTNQPEYQRLSVHVGDLRSQSGNRFSPKDDRLPLIGREKELAQLQKFLGESENIRFRWWAIVGPGGSGKSRLAYEFQKQLPPGWGVWWLSQMDYRNLSALPEKLTQPTLLIADYVQQHAQELGKWMQELTELHRSQPLRLLLVERDSSQAEGGFSWENSLYLGAGKGKLNQTRFDSFLNLQPLEDSKLGEIMVKYADKVRERTLPEKARDMLLKRLHSIDPDLQRPLYALFLTDAWLENPENPEQWDREKILRYITDREQDRLINVIRNTPDLAKAIRVLEPACLRLYAMATVWQDAPYAQLRELCPKAWQAVANYATNYGEAEDLLQAIGLGNENGVDALRPDLVGEYFVLSWLLEHTDQAQAFLQTAWQNPGATVVFLNRTIHDYTHLLNESPAHWRLLFPDIRLKSTDAAFYAAQLLVNATSRCTIPAECARLADQMEAIATAHSDKEMVILFAMGLVNLSCNQDTTGAADTVHRLEQLRNDHPSVPEIAIAFAKGLLSLTIQQDSTEAAKTVNRLEQQVKKHPDISEIAIRFAQGLVNLSMHQDTTGAVDTVNRLEQLMKKHSDVPEFAIRFAQGLFNLSTKQDATGAADTINRLEQLTKQHPDVPEIAIEFADGLYNLSNKQDARGAADTIHHLEQLRNAHLDIPEITIVFAGGLVNLAHNQDATEANKAVRRLEQLMNDYPGVPELTIDFAQGLVNLTIKQDATEAANTINRLEKLTKQHSDIPEIAIPFACGLSNLIQKQEDEGAVQALAKLVNLADGTIPVPEIAKEFAQCNWDMLTAPDEETKEANWARMKQIRASLNI